MKKEMIRPKMKVVFHVISILFLIESFLLILGISNGFIVYASRVDLATALFGKIFIPAGFVIVMFLNLIVYYSKVAWWLLAFFSFIIIYVGVYFLIIDGFEIL